MLDIKENLIQTKPEGERCRETDLGAFQADEVVAEGRLQREEGDGGPAQEVREHQQPHALGHASVVGVPRLE